MLLFFDGHSLTYMVPMIDPNIDRRLKNLENKIYIIENIVSSLKNTEDYRTRIFEERMNKILNDINVIKQEIESLKIKIKAIQDQMSLFAPVDRVKALEKYIDIIDPFSYLTKKEAERLIERKIKEILQMADIKVYKRDDTY